jgi:hypothetical protein
MEQSAQVLVNVGGRIRGSKNQVTRSETRAFLRKRKINPLDKIVDLIPNLSPAQQLKAWTFLTEMAYLKPKVLPAHTKNPITPSDPTSTSEEAARASQLLSIVDQLPNPSKTAESSTKK